MVQGYGHLDCWIGREAYKDGCPLIREQADKVTRGKEYRYMEPDWKDWKTWRNKVPVQSHVNGNGVNGNDVNGH